MDSGSSAIWQQRSSDRSSTTDTSSPVSPSPSSLYLRSQGITSTSAPPSGPWSDFDSLTPVEMQTSNPQQLASPPDQFTKLPKTDSAGNLSSWIEALGVDTGYKAPREQPIKPVACFYVLHRDPHQPEKSEKYRAIYLMQRTLKDFTNTIAFKWNLESTKIVRTLHVLDCGLQVEMDDDVIRELAEGQDLIMEIAEIRNPVKREWEMSLDVTVDSDHAGGTQHVTHTEEHEYRLMF